MANILLFLISRSTRRSLYVLTGLALLLALAPHASRATGPPPAALAAALAPDGTLRPGATGSFDATGYTLFKAPDGRPGFRPTHAARTTGAGDARWRDGFDVPGVNGGVTALAVAGNGDVYAGGFFNAAGGAPALGVAKWNGSAWSALGAGMYGSRV